MKSHMGLGKCVNHYGRVDQRVNLEIIFYAWSIWPFLQWSFGAGAVPSNVCVELPPAYFKHGQ